jgi:hypothetical protein
VNLRAPFFVKLEADPKKDAFWNNTVISRGKVAKLVCTTARPNKCASVVVVEKASKLLADQAAAAGRMWQATLSAPSVKRYAEDSRYKIGPAEKQAG